MSVCKFMTLLHTFRRCFISAIIKFCKNESKLKTKQTNNKIKNCFYWCMFYVKTVSFLVPTFHKCLFAFFFVCVCVFFLGVTLFCLLSTISTAFEHQHNIEYRMIDNLGRPCNQTVAKANAIQQHKTQQQHNQYQQQQQQQQEIPLKAKENFIEFLDETEGSGEHHNDQDLILSNDMNILQRITGLKNAKENVHRIKRSVDLRQQQLTCEYKWEFSNPP